MQTTLTTSELVRKATAKTPTNIESIYAFVKKFKPDVPNTTIRGRLYENVNAGKITKLAEGVYLAVNGEAAFLAVQGDAWEALEALDEDVLDLIITDQPYDLGTKQNVGKGTTRPHAEIGGRSYALKDLDARWLKAAFRALKKNSHMWRNLQTGDPKPGPGALIFFTPKLTRQTRKNIMALLDLAESIGFVYQGHVVWDRDTMGMGYAFGRSQVEFIHLLTAGDRGGVGWDLGMRDLFRFKALKNPTNGEEHESEKPVEVFMQAIRFCCRPGDILMDPFGGRAKWAKVAVEAGYNVIVNEIDSKWVERVASDFGSLN